MLHPEAPAQRLFAKHLPLTKITRLDVEVGKVMKRLKDLGLDDNAIVFFSTLMVCERRPVRRGANAPQGLAGLQQCLQFPWREFTAKRTSHDEGTLRSRKGYDPNRYVAEEPTGDVV